MYNITALQNVSSPDVILSAVSNEIPIFIPALLFFIWITVGLLAYYGTRKFQGQGDFFAATTASGFLTFVLGLALTLATGIMTVTNLLVLAIILIVSFALMFVRRNRE